MSIESRNDSEPQAEQNIRRKYLRITEMGFRFFGGSVTPEGDYEEEHEEEEGL